MAKNRNQKKPKKARSKRPPQQPRELTWREKRELQLAEISAAAVVTLSKSRKLTRNVSDSIQKILDGEVTETDMQRVPHDHRLRGIFSLVKQSPANRKYLQELLETLENAKVDWLGRRNRSRYVNALAALLHFSDNWVQSPLSWKPSTKNSHRQFASLLRHLLAKYDVPAFMDEAWTGAAAARPAVARREYIGQAAQPSRDRLYQRWWIHIAQGGNIRKVDGLPFSFTKKMAHHFLQAPKDFSIDGAIRWGQIHALGGDERLCRGVMTTSMREAYWERNHHDFWTSVIRFFIANPMLDTIHYGPIVDYLRNQKYVVPRGAESAPQPNLSMKNREATALLAQVEAWHARLGGGRRKGKKAPTTWDHHESVYDFSWEEKKKDDRVISYEVIQLLDSGELLVEGRRLKHCVASYAWSCANGSRSIWSVRRLQPGGKWEPLGTIELLNSARQVVQFRAKLNGEPDPKAWFLMEKWANKNNLGISRWIKTRRY